jgi:salicylate hydroxylase
MTSQTTPIVIAGGGIGGLATAIAIARTGRSVHLLEQANDFGEIGAGVQLAPNGMRALKALGIVKIIEDLSWRPEHWVMYDGLSGDTIFRLPIRDAMQARFGQPYIVIHRADLLQTLFDAANAVRDKIKLERKSKVVSFLDEGHRVAVSLDDGRTIHGAGLIGADGLNSAVRKQILNDGPAQATGLVAYRAVVRREDAPKELWCPDVVAWTGPKGDLVHYPMRGGQHLNLIATYRMATPPDPSDMRGSKQDLYDAFEGFASPVIRGLDKLNHDRRWVVCARQPAKGWSRGRATLLGDAAHPMMQYLAQGACQALEDAVQISEDIERHPNDLVAAFSAYEHARRFRTARAQLQARMFEQLFHIEGATADMRAKVFETRTVEDVCEILSWIYDYPAEVGEAQKTRRNYELERT